MFDELTYRTWNRDDLPHMADIINAANVADGVERVETVAQLAAAYDHLENCDPATDIVVAEDGGRVIGYARCVWREEPDGGRIFFNVGELHPEWRRRGVGSRLYDHIDARIRDIAASHPPGPKQTASWAWESAVGRVALYESRGLARASYDALMVRPDLEEIPNAAFPEGLEVRTPGPDEFRAVWEADDEAFRDHWGYTKRTESDYEEFLADPWLDPSLWKIAWDGDQIAGQVRSFIDCAENEALGRIRGYTEDISVRRPYRRQGLARALLVQSLHELRARGMQEAALQVHVENPHGAYGLYESVGFQVVATNSDWRKDL